MLTTVQTKSRPQTETFPLICFMCSLLTSCSPCRSRPVRGVHGVRWRRLQPRYPVPRRQLLAFLHPLARRLPHFRCGRRAAGRVQQTYCCRIYRHSPLPANDAPDPTGAVSSGIPPAAGPRGLFITGTTGRRTPRTRHKLLVT